LLRLRRLFDGRLPDERFAHLERVRQVSIAATPPVVVQADGQLVGRTPVVASLLPAAIRVLCNPKEPA